MPTTINGTTGVSQIQAGATSDSLPVFQCRAWVNFDGTRDSTGAASTANTNRFIRASGNVASVLRNGTGDYTVNFTTAMPDANYSVSGNTGPTGGTHSAINYLAGSCRIITVNASGTGVDNSFVSTAIFR